MVRKSGVQGSGVGLGRARQNGDGGGQTWVSRDVSFGRRYACVVGVRLRLDAGLA